MPRADDDDDGRALRARAMADEGGVKKKKKKQRQKSALLGPWLLRTKVKKGYFVRCRFLLSTRFYFEAENSLNGCRLYSVVDPVPC